MLLGNSPLTFQYTAPIPTSTPTPTPDPAPPPLAGDINQDFVLNQKDIFPIIKTFNTKPPIARSIGGSGSVLAAISTDINNDGRVNAFDYAVVAENIVNPLGIPAVTKSYDVVVVGAGTGGVAAAVQAARQGAKVALIEETVTGVGGQMSSADVSTIDEGTLFLILALIRSRGIRGSMVSSAKRSLEIMSVSHIFINACTILRRSV